MSDIWALCCDCDRWFPAPAWFDRTAPSITCPTCGAEPTAMENRALVARHQERNRRAISIVRSATGGRPAPAHALR